MDAPERTATAAGTEPVVKTVTVPLTPKEAFVLFTDDIASWWPLHSYSVAGDEAVDCRFEPRVGGRLYEVARDGTESEWGEILAWEPPARIELTWHPGDSVDAQQHLVLGFRAVDGGTELRLEHRGWERLGERGAAVRESYQSGWDEVLGRYVGAASGRSGSAQSA